MDKSRLAIIIFTTILTFSALYAPQPVQPIIMEYFNISQSQSALLTTVTMFPLSISPIFYGYMLESVSSKKMLLVSLIVIAICQFIFFLSDSFNLLLVLRVIEGLAIPAVLTGIMTYIARMTTKDNVQKIMAIYISSTIIGGFSGRFFSGLISYYTNWRTVFFILGVSLLGAVIMIWRLGSSKAEVHKLDLKAAAVILRKRSFFVTYMMVFSMFFMFTGVMNFIPYRLREIDPSSSAMLIGVIYTGYIMGIVTSLNSLKLIRIFRGEGKCNPRWTYYFPYGSCFVYSSQHIYLVFWYVRILCGYVYDPYCRIRVH